MKCPECGNEKWEKINLGGFVVEKCESCRGIWFDGGEFYRAVEPGTYYAEQIDKEKEIINKPEIAKECPVCEAAMKRVNRHGVMIDICRDCKGIWCDEGEFIKLAQNMHNHGLI